jgi:hypothetical protein
LFNYSTILDLCQVKLSFRLVNKSHSHNTFKIRTRRNERDRRRLSTNHWASPWLPHQAHKGRASLRIACSICGTSFQTPKLPVSDRTPTDLLEISEDPSPSSPPLPQALISSLTEKLINRSRSCSSLLGNLSNVLYNTALKQQILYSSPSDVIAIPRHPHGLIYVLPPTHLSSDVHVLNQQINTCA